MPINFHLIIRIAKIMVCAVLCVVLHGSQRSEPLVLNVYLEGDGTPWRYRTIVMPDPTPRRPLMLELMSADPSWSLYLGRPCYNGTSRDAGCDNRLWTSARYSPQVVDSMASAIRVISERHDVDEIRLFGHSGGGALAVLLTEQLSNVKLIVTIAGNLDIDAWTDHHGRISRARAGRKGTCLVVMITGVAGEPFGRKYSVLYKSATRAEFPVSCLNLQ